MTAIESVHERLMTYRNAAPNDNDDVTEWIAGHDGIERQIGDLNAESLGDVLIKLGLLCERLEQACVCDGDLRIANSARNDLRRLVA